MRILSLLLAILLVVPADAAITFTVTHADNTAGWNDPTLGKARRDTLQAVFTYLNTVLDENGVIDYQTAASNYDETGAIASALPRFSNAPNGFSSGHPFVHASTGVDPSPGTADATITVDWGYSLSPGLNPPPNGQLDLYSVLLHEVTHSLGFLTRIKPDANSAVTNTDPGVYTVMDSFARLGNVAPATPLFATSGNYTGIAADLSDFSPGIFFWGPAGMAASGGKPLKLFQTNPHGLGSGLSHTGQLMGPTIANNDMKRTYSVRDLGMLRDIGWTIKPQSPIFLGPKVITFMSDPVPVNDPPSNDLNDLMHGKRFKGSLGGLLLDVYPNVPPPVYDEDSSTSSSAGRTGHDDLTGINHPDAPGAIVLKNGDGAHSRTGLTWISPRENFRFPARSDEKFVVAFDANPDPRIADAAWGTFLDTVVGASKQAMKGGAASSDGVGVRLNVSGPYDGMWQIFDGTGSASRVEASGPLPRPAGWISVAIELLEPSFDDATPTVVNVLIDGEVVHSFTTDGGIGDNYVSFHAGPSVDETEQPALYLLDDVDIGIEPWADAQPVVTVAPVTSLVGVIGTPYSATFAANGGTAPYEWWIEGALPEGLLFLNGTITGTPLQSGTFQVTVSTVDYGFFVGKTTREIVIAGKGRRRAAGSL
ncbi:MAG TPA: hypothetical protein VGQ76_13530 [Thermoanaerobaculia bacterium]|nr:hypothetical protein [Thermoanaerobaculia bacterium]